MNEAHKALAVKWLEWNGLRGTEKQVTKLMAQLNYETLQRMCQARGIH